MAILSFNESSVGAPNSGRISGTAGDFYAMIKWAAPQNSWALEYDDPINFRCVLRPAVGNRFRMYVDDSAATSGSACLTIVRGCENASGTTYATLVDPFPTVAQVADTSANWIKSSVVGTTARLFDLLIAETWIKFAVKWSGTNELWELHEFGDFAPALAGDSYNTLCTVRNNSATGGNGMWWNWIASSSTAATSQVFIARSYDGTVKSVRGGIAGKYLQTNLGLLGSGVSAALQGPTTGIDTELCSIIDNGSNTGTGSATTALPKRGWWPNLLSPQHNGAGTLTERYTYAETPYMASGMAVIAGTRFAVVQTSDDWVAPTPV